MKFNLMVFVVTNELHGREITHYISSDAPIILVKKRETIIGFESVRVLFDFEWHFLSYLKKWLRMTFQVLMW